MLSKKAKARWKELHNILFSATRFYCVLLIWAGATVALGEVSPLLAALLFLSGLYYMFGSFIRAQQEVNDIKQMEKEIKTKRKKKNG